MSYKVSNKGQIVIDKEIRDRLGIEPGWIAVQRQVGDRVEIRFYPGPHERSLAGALADAVRRRPEEPVDWHEVEEEAWAAAARRKVGRGD